MKKNKLKRIGDIFWDWKDIFSTRDLNKILKPYGIVFRKNPICSGTDSYGYIIYKKNANRTN